MSLILLIDDEPQMAGLVEMSLDDLGVRVASAADLSEAIEAARTERPRLILLDIALKRENGLELLPRLKQEPELAEVPVVMFSVHDSMREQALLLGANGFVAKPFRAKQLRDVVEPYFR